VYEVFKVVLRETGENEALQSVGAMQKGRIVELTAEIAMLAARMGLRHHLPMANSIILATANAYQCVIWTQDAGFEHLPGVKFFPKMP
jgi:predicted nucleic acid-binding protein